MSLFKMLKKGDYLVLSAVCFLAFILFIQGQASLHSDQNRYLIIEVDNRLIREEPLFAKNGSSRYITVPVERGKMTLEIYEGRVRMLPACRKICPLGICAVTGWIEHSGQIILCLPNRLVVKITGKAEDPLNLDGITN